MLGSDEYTEAALEGESEKSRRENAANCIDSMKQESESAYNTARRREGLSQGDLGFGVVLNRTNSKFFGVFAGLAFTQISNVLESDKPWQAAVIFLSITMVLLAAENVFLETFGEISWIVSRNWTIIWMRFISFVTMIMLFLTTTFVLAVFNDLTKTAESTNYELVGLIVIFTLAFYYFINAHKKISQ